MRGYSVKRLGFLGVFLGLFVLVAMLFYPFLTVIVWSSLFYAFLSPIFQRVTTRKDGAARAGPLRNGIAAAMALGGVLLIAVPAAFLGIAMAKQLSAMARDAILALERDPSSLGLGPDGPVASFLSAVSGGSIEMGDPAMGLRHLLASRANEIMGFSGRLLKDILNIFIDLVFMVFTIYFLLVDGEHLSETFIGAIPIERGYTSVFLKKFKEMGRRLISGYFLVALLQATIMLILCLAFSVKGGLVIAALTAIASFIPVVGTSLVLLPVAASMYASGDLAGALLFLALAATLVWTVDNFVRPLLLHDRLKIHPLLIFFSILGGLAVFKFNGIVLGPLILVLFFTALDFFKDAYDRPRQARDAPREEESPYEAEGRAGGAEAPAGAAPRGRR